VVKPLKPRSRELREQLEDTLRLGERFGDKEIVRSTKEELAKIDAVENWVDRNLTNYIKKQMATPEDPVRKLAEQGIVHMPPEQMGYGSSQAYAVRKKLGAPKLAQSEAAQAWEDATDVSMHPQLIKHIDPTLHSFHEPWMEKADPNTKVWTALDNMNASDLGFDHIVDVLKHDLASGRIRPEQLNKVSMEQAVRRTYEYDQEMAKKMAEAQIKATEGMPVHKEYPEGYKWIELAQPKMPDVIPEGWTMKEPKNGVMRAVRPDPVDPQFQTTVLGTDLPDLIKNIYKRHPDTPGNPNAALEQALKYEGETMGHCVGNYCPDVAAGKSRIYSLRDTKGEPHVTVEVKPSNVQEALRNLPAEERHALAQSVKDQHFGGVMPGVRDEDKYWEMVDQAYIDKYGTPAPTIKQIKGKQNQAPKEQYLPFVQDFVRSGEWSDVGDLRNTGLRDIHRTPALKTYLEGKGETFNRFVPEQQYKEYEDDYLMDRLYPKEEGMAAGGVPKPPSDEIREKLRQLRDSFVPLANEFERQKKIQDNLEKMNKKISFSDNPDSMMMDVEEAQMAGGGDVRGYDNGGSIKATPRSEGWGMAADVAKAIEDASKEQFGYKNPATEVIADFLGIPAVARTLERKAYGEPITNIGKANVPLLPDDTAETLMTVAPLAKPAAKGAKAAGKLAASEIEKAMFGESSSKLLNELTPQVMSAYRPHTPLKPDPDVGTRYKKQYVGGLAPRKDLDIQDLEKSSVKIFPWDATSRNQLITEVSDVPLTKPVLTEGGDEYMMDLQHMANRIAGASNEGIAKRIVDRINQASVENQMLGGTGKVYGFPIRMGEGAENAATFPTDVVMDLLNQAGLKKKELKELDTSMRNMLFEGDKGAFKDMAPIGTPEFEHQLRAGLKSDKEKKITGFTSMNLRKALMNRLGLVEYQKRLGYNLPDLTGAVLSDELKGVPKGYVGNVAAELDPFTNIRPSKSSTYSHDFSGQYAGSMPNMPVEFLMPNVYESIYREMKEKYPKFAPEALRNMTIGAMEKRKDKISELIGPRSVDAVKTFQEGLMQGEFDPYDINQVYDYMRRKKMGLNLDPKKPLKKAAGGEITAEDLDIEERPL
jgi:hypothetical protein